MSEVQSDREFKPTSNIVIDASQAKTLKVGEEMSISVTGKVKGIREMYDKKGMFEVTLEHKAMPKDKSSDDMKKDLPVAERD